MAIKLLWLKPDKHYITRKGSRLTSAQSSILQDYTALDTLLSTLLTLDFMKYINLFFVPGDSSILDSHECLTTSLTHYGSYISEGPVWHINGVNLVSYKLQVLYSIFSLYAHA